MQFSCPCCKTDYVVPAGEMPRGYCKVVCSHCGYKWRRAIGVTTDLLRQAIGQGQDLKPDKTSSLLKPEYRPEVLAILREEAAVETRLRQS